MENTIRQRTSPPVLCFEFPGPSAAANLSRRFRWLCSVVPATWAFLFLTWQQCTCRFFGKAGAFRCSIRIVILDQQRKVWLSTMPLDSRCPHVSLRNCGCWYESRPAFLFRERQLRVRLLPAGALSQGRSHPHQLLCTPAFPALALQIRSIRNGRIDNDRTKSCAFILRKFRFKHSLRTETNIDS